MKKFLYFLFLSLSAVVLTISAAASNKISPAIDVLAYENSMIKTGIVYNGDISFDTDDFDVSLNTSVNKIVICSLPNEEAGRLMLDNLYVVENQVILREDFSALHFVPTSFDDSEASFNFEANDSGYELTCTLKAIKNVNFTPSATNGDTISTWTQENISCYGNLSGHDPDGDKIKFEIVSYPKKGIIELTNAETGDYKYTPYKEAKGVDAFSYRVVDSYGNFSETTKVSIRVEKLRTNLVFDDMANNRHLNAALVMAEFDIMECIKSENGETLFAPDKSITREEFLVLLMKTMGAKNVPVIEQTRFADNEDILKENRGYVEAALSLGIIKGINESDGLHFYPKENITLAEASIMINKILGGKFKENVNVFDENEIIPEWAKDALSSLIENGIITKTDGKLNATAPLTRAQTAQILMSLLEYRGKLN